jgi:hypothetical protein
VAYPLFFLKSSNGIDTRDLDRGVEAKQLDKGIGDTFVSPDATRTLPISIPLNTFV